MLICYTLLAVSMTSLEAIKKGVPIRPALPYNDHVYAKFEFTVTVYYGLWGKTSSWVSLKTPDDILLFKINLTLFCNASTQ